MKLQEEDVLWIGRRLPKAVVALLNKYPAVLFVAGGFIRATIAREEVNDIDIFAPSKEQAHEAAKEYAALDSNRKLIVSDNAYTVVGDRLPVQFIHRWTFTTPEECVNSFDFTIARAAIWSHGGSLHSVCSHRFYPDLAGKRLVYCKPVRNEDAGGSLLRVLKFYQRGYRIPLDSFGAVLARLSVAVRADELPHGMPHEDAVGYVYTGLLREVDPSVADPSEAE